MAATSRKAVFVALAGNTFLAVIKLLAFLVSGSGAMFSEAIHSIADAGNQGLLYLGIRRSERPADTMFHYGYGSERYFYALLSAVGIFVLGCGVTVHHGIQKLLHPTPVTLTWVSFAVLALSFLVEGYVLLRAIQVVRINKGELGFWKFIRRSPDPTVLAVLFEDSVACVGVCVALAGISLTYLTGVAAFDASASILIGLMMGGVALWLGARNRQLILGQAIPSEVQADVVDIVRRQPSVQSVHDIKSRVLAADSFRLKAEVDFDGRVLAREHVDWVRSQAPELADPEGFAEAFGDRMLDSLAREVDRIEAEIIRRYPQLRHLDLESHFGEPPGPSGGDSPPG